MLYCIGTVQRIFKRIISKFLEIQRIIGEFWGIIGSCLERERERERERENK